MLIKLKATPTSSFQDVLVKSHYEPDTRYTMPPLNRHYTNSKLPLSISTKFNERTCSSSSHYQSSVHGTISKIVSKYQCSEPSTFYLCLILLPMRPSGSLDMLVAGSKSSQKLLHTASTESFLLFFEVKSGFVDRTVQRCYL